MTRGVNASIRICSYRAWALFGSMLFGSTFCHLAVLVVYSNVFLSQRIFCHYLVRKQFLLIASSGRNLGHEDGTL